MVAQDIEISFDKKKGLITMKLPPAMVTKIYKQLSKAEGVKIQLLPEGFLVCDKNVQYSHSEGELPAGYA